VCNGLPAYEKKERKNKIKLIRLPFVVWFYATATFRVVSEIQEHKQKGKKKMPHRHGGSGELLLLLLHTQLRENQNPRWGFPFEIAKGTSVEPLYSAI
jgi:hypothetical protein